MRELLLRDSSGPALLKTVVQYTGKSEEKVRNESFKACLFLARQPHVGAACLAQLVLGRPSQEQGKSSSSSKKWRPLYGRLKIVAQMVFEFGFGEASGLNLRGVMDFAAPAFEHQNLQVRRAAVDLFVEAYMQQSGPAEHYISGLKPALQVSLLRHV